MVRPLLSTAVEALWQLEPIGSNRFLGWCRDGAIGRAFGGQVAAQALAAAGADVPEGWRPTSLQAYFAREGRTSQAIEYCVEDVDAVDPRRHLSRVTAVQDEKAILTLDASFAPFEDELAPVDRGDSGADLNGWAPSEPEEVRWLQSQTERVRFDLRFPDQPARFVGRSGRASPGQYFWFRAYQPLPDAPVDHACGIAYASDLFLVSTALATHGLPGRDTVVQAASLDHSVWFHRIARADEWLCYEQTSPTSAGARGLSTGRILDRAGRLVATVHQEVLMRVSL
jgi:acyl-CoA thioesterase-2